MDESSLHRELATIGRKLSLSSKAYSDLVSPLASRTLSIDGAMRAITKQLDLERQIFGSTNAILKQLNQLPNLSPNIQSLASANANLSKMIERISVPNTTFSRAFTDQKRIQKIIKGIGLTDSLTTAFTRIDTARIVATSLAAQQKLVNLDGLALGRLVGIDGAFGRATATHLGNLTRSYQSLIDAAATCDSVASLLPLITTYPPVEYYREIEVLESVTVDEESDEKKDDAVEAGLIDVLPRADDLLAEFDESLCRLLLGARQSLRSDNPDRARHVTTSVRELFTQVLHALAPDEEIRQWNANEELFHNNRPTRRARLLFICRNINCDPLTRFVEDDIRAALSFIDSLNSGTHVIESNLTLPQLGSIVSRMESLIVFLLKLRNPD